MKASINVLLRRRVPRRSEGAAREIEEEFRFHLEMLTQAYLEQEMSREEAKKAARRQFGDVERLKSQCLAVTRGSHPFLVALKTFLAMIFLAGLVLRFVKVEANIHHLGDLLIAVPILSCLLLYVRRLNPLRFVAGADNASPLRLNENVPLFTAYDQGMRTPVERLISDK